MRTAFAFALAFLASVPAQPPTPSTTFKGGTELVLVDLVVTDTSDHPVAGLSVGDFVVKEDGKTRPIVSFQAFGAGAVVLHKSESGDASTNAATSVPAAPPVRSADASTVLVVDDGHLSLTEAGRLRPALRTLLTRVGERQGAFMLVAPVSQISVLGVLPGNAGDLSAVVDKIVGHRIDDTDYPIAEAEAYAIVRGDLEVLKRVVGRLVTMHPETPPAEMEAVAHERAIDVAHDATQRRETLYHAVLLCLDWLAPRPGRHSLILASGGFARELSDSRYDEVVTRSLRANAPIHFLDARGLGGFSPYQSAQYSAPLTHDTDEGPFGRYDAAEGSTILADDTGGLTIGNSNNLERGLERLLDTMTTYYVLAYQPPAHDKPGFRKIKVEVRGKGLRVRARRGYFASGR